VGGVQFHSGANWLRYCLEHFILNVKIMKIMALFLNFFYIVYSFSLVFLVLQKEEHFNPTAFFLILLPPIIFESGYSLHKVRSQIFT